MAQPANLYDKYDLVGVREDLTDVIYDISPEDTPYSSFCKRRGEVKNTFHEWQQDELAAPDTANAQIEGDDASLEAATPTVRIGNYTQISRKVVGVSGTAEVVNKAGRKSELSYQVTKKGKELKRDIEKILVSNQAAAAGSSSVARKSASFLAFIKTNVEKGAGGVDPSYTNVPNDVRTDGTPRAFTETILKTVLEDCYREGAEIKVAMMGPTQKGVASSFAGIATKTIDQSARKPATVIGSVDFYVSDWGTIEFVPNRHMRDTDVFLLDPEYLDIMWLRRMFTKKLAVSGDSEKRLMLGEWIHKIGAENSQGLITDLS